MPAQELASLGLQQQIPQSLVVRGVPAAVKQENGLPQKLVLQVLAVSEAQLDPGEVGPPGLQPSWHLDVPKKLASSAG